ncbi:MAG: XrtA system polysaccharide chain length determinant [Gammaproteobacteria bacterium]
MHDLFAEFMTHIQGMWRFRWYGLALAWLVAGGGWASVYLMPDQYEASARVYVDTQSVLKPLLKGLAVETDVMTEVNMVSSALLSGPNLEKVATETNLISRAATSKDLEKLLNGLKRALKIEPSAYQNMYTISFQDTDPQMAKRVVEAFVGGLVHDTMGSKKSDSTAAHEFLVEQIREYESRLTVAEQRLANFKREHVGTMPRRGEDYYGQLQSAGDLLNSKRADLRIALNTRDQLRKQLEGEVPVFGLMPDANRSSSATTALDLEIAKQRVRLNELRLQYTDKHPDIEAINQVLDELHERKSVEQEALNASPAAALEKNPIFQNMKISASRADVEVARLQTEVADAAREMKRLQKLVDTIPEVEANLVRLNRDYEITKAQYEALVERLESARLSEEAEQRSEFRIIDPAVAPLIPSGPPRTLFLGAVLLAAMGGAFAVMFLLHQLRPVFGSTRAVRQHTDFPVLGTVSMKWMPRQKMSLRLGLGSFAVVLMLLIAAFVGAVKFKDTGPRVVQDLVASVELPL